MIEQYTYLCHRHATNINQDTEQLAIEVRNLLGKHAPSHYEFYSPVAVAASNESCQHHSGYRLNCFGTAFAYTKHLVPLDEPQQ